MSKQRPKNRTIPLALRFEDLLLRYKLLIGLTIFILGIALSLGSLNFPGSAWAIAGRIGVFLTGVISVAFLYSILIRKDDRAIFLADLRRELQRRHSQNSIVIHETGRPPLMHKTKLMKKAGHAIVQTGVSLRTTVSYFQQMPSKDYHDVVLHQVSRGIKYSFYVLDPDSEIAATYAVDRKEPDLPDIIRMSIRRLSEIRNDLRKVAPGTEFRIFTYNQYPTFYLMEIDGSQPNGIILLSHYLTGKTRANAPYLEIYRMKNPTYFTTYQNALRHIVKNSTEINYEVITDHT